MEKKKAVKGGRRRLKYLTFVATIAKGDNKVRLRSDPAIIGGSRRLLYILDATSPPTLPP